MHLSIRSLFAAPALAAFILPAAHAGRMPIVNAQMDPDPAVTLQPGDWVTLPGGTGTYRSEDPAPGWTIAGFDSGIAQPTADMFDRLYPNSFAFIGGTLQNGSLSQELGTLRAKASYTFTINIGSRKDCDYGGYLIQFLADGAPLATFQDTDRTLVKKGSFRAHSFNFDGAGHGGKKLTVVLSAIVAGANLQVDYDKPQLTFTVPAPAVN